MKTNIWDLLQVNKSGAKTVNKVFQKRWNIYLLNETVVSSTLNLFNIN